MINIELPDRIEDVVVVVHNDDMDLAILQLKSIETFLESCTLHIIINETDTTIVEAYVGKYLTTMKNHTIKIWSRHDILKCHPNVPGWTTQQLLKLLIPLKRNWIVLDCKDILIRPLQLIDLDKRQQKDYIDLSLKDPQGLFYQGCCELTTNGFLTGSVQATDINQNQTPRVIDNRVIRKIGQIFKTRENFIDWFCSYKVQGEFILHDYISTSLGIPPKLRFPVGFLAGIWGEHNFKEHTFDKIEATTHIYKCHRRVYNIQENREKVNAWVEKIIATYNDYQDAIKGK